MNLIKTVLIFLALTSIGHAESETQVPTVQSAVKIYYCVKTREYSGGVRPDAELYLKVIRISDGSTLANQLIANFDSETGGGGTNLGACQVKASELNSRSK